MKLTQKSFVIAGISCMAWWPVFATGPKQNEKPNILFILADDLGYGDLSCQGGKDIQTPNIDLLFKQGARFANFYANCTVCSPTRASLLTGCYPDMVGVPGVSRRQEENSWGYSQGKNRFKIKLELMSNGTYLLSITNSLETVRFLKSRSEKNPYLYSFFEILQTASCFS